MIVEGLVDYSKEAKESHHESGWGEREHQEDKGQQKGEHPQIFKSKEERPRGGKCPDKQNECFICGRPH